ncbi:hypothetical protein ACTI_01090 [Actinoplanes sp. OR16]|uniref:hypothetical protein n=1 Tax=Actinoplanes sp. OR16 TaxID=946334 RepID=UPI000F703107|nr:hypothetical protein [Actinoplanes sp. OR16]BBH63424.1 hypothetical protein ACTI_01090 [Actinoplanes sp. OR16]
MTNSDDLHAEAEKAAVPSFDWMSTPVLSVVDGLLHIDPDAPLPRRRHHIPKPTSTEHAPDNGAIASSRMLADLSRSRRAH